VNVIPSLSTENYKSWQAQQSLISFPKILESNLMEHPLLPLIAAIHQSITPFDDIVQQKLS
jgi:hypothetical protein